MSSRRQIEYALDRWCVGDQLARGRMADDLRREYDVVVAAAGTFLGRCDRLDGLVAAYFGDDPADCWPDEWCRRPGGHVLEADVVKDAAYWRRYQELLAPSEGAASGQDATASAQTGADDAQTCSYCHQVVPALPGNAKPAVKGDSSLLPSGRVVRRRSPPKRA